MGYAGALIGFVVAVVWWPPGKLVLLGMLMTPLLIFVAYHCLESVISEDQRWTVQVTPCLRRAIWTLVLALVGLGLVDNQGPRDAAISAAVVITIAAGLLLAARIRPGRRSARAQPLEMKWAGILFLILLAVAPTLAVYRVVSEAEVHRFVVSAQTRLAAALGSRARRLEDRALSLDLGRDPAERRREMLDARLRPPQTDIYSRSFLDTKVAVCDQDGPCDVPPPPDVASLSRLNSATWRLLERITMAFDEHSRRLASVAAPPTREVPAATIVSHGRQPWPAGGPAP